MMLFATHILFVRADFHTMGVIKSFWTWVDFASTILYFENIHIIPWLVMGKSFFSLQLFHVGVSTIGSTRRCKFS